MAFKNLREGPRMAAMQATRNRAPELPAGSRAAGVRRAPSILMICPQFRPLVGGYERAAERLSGALAGYGCTVCVVTERRQADWPQREELDGVQVKRLACRYRPRWHMATSIASHAAWLLRHGRRFDVWHVHQYGLHATLTIILGKVLQRRVVLKLTNSAQQGIDATLADAPFPRLQRWAHRRVDACAAVTEETMREACAFGIARERALRIPNGVDTDSFQPPAPAERDALRERLGLARDACLAVSVGRLAHEKNPLGIVEAWARARPAFRAPWLLAFVGDGPLRAAVASRVRELGLDGNVRIVGHCDRVQDWLRAADLFVLGSHNEGMANTALEAMACGLPSVVTAVSGMDALMTQTGAGLVAPPGDAAALAQRLVELHDDAPRRRAMGAAAREAILSGYSISQIAQRYLALYERLRPGSDRG